jgi:DNA-binding winged helix-turn-helix (wHTH) protein
MTNFIFPRAMNRLTLRYYEFGPFRLDVERRLLLREGKAVRLPPKALETLLVLLERRGQVVTTETLMSLLWPNTEVEESNLTFNICRLRRALGEQPRDHCYVVTVPRRGYLFVAPLQASGIEETDTAAASRPWPMAHNRSFSFTLSYGRAQRIAAFRRDSSY